MEGGKEMSVEEVLQRIAELDTKLTVITGGEPLLQADSSRLISELLDKGHDIQVETNGAKDIGVIDKRASVIMDLKCPSSGESEKNLLSNIQKLKSGDEVKFVIGTKEDYEWAKNIMRSEKFPEGCSKVFSWAAPTHSKLQSASREQYKLNRKELADLILSDKLDVRFIPQLQKIIWGYETDSI